jgi:ubiquinone/menaquinone biosynthesis C-methylase UbiE
MYRRLQSPNKYQHQKVKRMRDKALKTNWLETNRKSWNDRVDSHKKSSFYDLDVFKKTRDALMPIEKRELGDVSNKSLLHLQCHFGMDTLSWAERGATVTGVDFSEKAIDLARELATELNYPDARFIHADIYDLPNHLEGQFDVVFTSYGTVGWLPDIDKWAAIVAHFLKPNGTFYIADFHPFVWTLSNDFSKIAYNYFGGEPIVEVEKGTYADRNAPIKNTSVSWNHSLSSIINALINNGLQIGFVNEYPYSPYNCFEKTVLGDDGFYRIEGIENMIPMMYSIKATNTKI